MGMSRVTYNDYQFPDRSNFSVQEEFVYDEANVTVVATRFTLRIETIICVEDISVGSQGTWESPDYNVGAEMHRIRQLLSKPGRALLIQHEGFFNGDVEINGYGPIKDSAWGPHPKFLQWNPIGHTISAEVVWECEFTIPICDGYGSPSFRGLAALNYSIGYRYDTRGYTTRTISGYIEIAMTRNQRGSRVVNDTVDRYRDRVIALKPNNFTREVSWDVSKDKRRADFTITDREISSPNAWPPGVVYIQATHRVGWVRSSITRISNTISATIEMAPDQLKARAWMIFRDIVLKRLQYGQNAPVLISSIDIIEEIYQNKVSFQIGYDYLEVIDLSELFAITGLFQPVSYADGTNLDWQLWDDSVKHLQPLRGNGTDRGIAQLAHNPGDDKIIDLCDNPVRFPSPQGTRNQQGQVSVPVFQNQLPPPESSWLVFKGYAKYVQNSSSFMSVTLAPNDLNPRPFNPRDPSRFGVTTDEVDPAVGVKRFIEEHAATQVIEWSGYAERVGYEIPKPGRMQLAGIYLKPIGKGAFMQQYMGDYFGQPKYGASWKQNYKLVNPPAILQSLPVVP